MTEPAANRPLLLRAKLLDALGVPHCFSTRQGGVSRGVFHSLNFGNPGGLEPAQRDPPANIARNLELVLAEVGAAGRRIVEVHQVHGCEVAFSADRAHTASDSKADGIVSSSSADAVAVRVADCCPVLLASTNGQVVAAVHAGWKGCIAGVVGNTIAAMRTLTDEPLAAAIGPCIGPDQFEVGAEVAAQFHQVFGDTGVVLRHPQPAKARIDLQIALRLQLLAAGLAPAEIEIVRLCTVSDPELFFSHRRDAGLTGRMVGLIGARP